MNIRHNISLYSNKTMFEELWIVSYVLMGFVALFSTAIPGAWFLIPTTILILHSLLFITHSHRGMTEGERQAWDTYRELSPESQTRIGLTRKYLVSLPTGKEWLQLRENIFDLHKAEKTQREVEGTEPSAKYDAIFKELIHERQESIQIAREVRQKMESPYEVH